MCASTPDRDYLLYRPERAFDAALDLGAAPRRFWKVLYPLYRVPIEVTQRQATDFEPIEELLERGIARAELHSVDELAAFFALDRRLVANLVHRLTAIGHIELNQVPLRLTELGLRSLEDELSYTRLLTRHVLYFDVLTCEPLLRAHYRLRFYGEADLDDPGDFEFILHHYRSWDDQALARLKARRNYHDYNLPDEIEPKTLRYVRPDQQPDEIVYLPVYIVERAPDLNLDLPRLLVFSMIQGYRDPVLEAGINAKKSDLDVLFREDEHVDLPQAVAEKLRERGHRADEWVFEQNGRLGPEIALFTPREPPPAASAGQPRPLSLLNIGRYLTLRTQGNNYCIWVTCPDSALRRQAIKERAVEWLDQSRYSRAPEEVGEWLARRSHELEVTAPTTSDLAEYATQREKWHAVELLEGMTS